MARLGPAARDAVRAVALVAGAASTLIWAFAPNMVVVVGGALMFAVTAAGVFVVSYTMVREMYSAERAGVLLGVVSTLMCVGMVAGSILGGVLIDMIGWRATAHCLWPPFLAAAGLVWFGVRLSPAAARPLASGDASFDVLGCVGFGLCLGGLVLALTLGPTDFARFGSPGNWRLLALAAVGGVAMTLTLRAKGDRSFMPVSVFRDRNTRALTTMGTLVRIGVTVAFLLFLSPATPIWVVFGLMFVGGVYNVQIFVTMSVGPQIQVPANRRVQGNAVVQIGQNLGAGLGTAVYTMVIAMFGLAAGFKIALSVATLTVAQGLRPAPDEPGALPERQSRSKAGGRAPGG